MFFFFKQKTAYEMRISDWSSDVCSSDLQQVLHLGEVLTEGHHLLARCTQFGNGRGDLADRGVAGEAHAVHAQQHAFDAVVGARLVERAQQVAQLHFMHAGAAERAERAHADRKSTRLNSSHSCDTRKPYSACKKKPQTCHRTR